MKQRFPNSSWAGKSEAFIIRFFFHLEKKLKIYGIFQQYKSMHPMLQILA